MTSLFFIDLSVSVSSKSLNSLMSRVFSPLLSTRSTSIFSS